MQCISGSRLDQITVADVVCWAQGYERVALDLGTGDGRFVAELARKSPDCAVIGIDLCAANMATTSRRVSGNARFLVADACALPDDLIAAVDRLTIAFPWGSLLRGILAERGSLIPRLVHAVRPGAKLEIVINADASASCALDLTTAESRIVAALATTGDSRPTVTPLDAADLKAWPSTWAKRLAFGRDPHAIAISSHVSTGWRGSSAAFARSKTLYHPARGNVSAVSG